MQENQTCLYSCTSDYCFTEKANGIKYLYASVVKHPDVFTMVILVPMVAMSSSSHSNGFDVHFDVDAQPQLITSNHTNRGFGIYSTVPNYMGHDETVHRTGDYETAALPLSYTGAELV